MKDFTNVSQNPMQIIEANIVLNTHQLMQIFNVSRGTLDKFRKQKNFPKPIEMGGNRPMWITEEIVKWIKTRK